MSRLLQPGTSSEQLVNGDGRPTSSLMTLTVTLVGEQEKREDVRQRLPWECVRFA